MNLPSLRRETRYGMPAADQIMFNRHYVLGYSYYFRQAKWALEIIDPDNPGLDRLDNFRPDYRIPEMFRADLVDYTSSGYDRGHLVASANQRETELQNSETFLLSNMSPQEPQFNRGIWKDLETRVRELDRKSRILETYVICGPIFYFDQPVESIGADDPNEVTIPIPNAYFKSVLAENNRGTLLMWSFVMPNEDSDQSLDTFLVPTTLVEKLAGIKLWQRLTGKKIDREKSRVRRMW
ncbi:MAG: DNA/RNA non-specific endonuclease [Candidatus Zixiibacteriota bacterium]|nr:MAG: DNA/RNA non-specific endonuclease [candidate division Zixibacteria bacterium]